jgi:hypothetical protein
MTSKRTNPEPKRGRGRPPKAKPEAEQDLVYMASNAFGGPDGYGDFLDLDDAELVKASLRNVLKDKASTPAAIASAARTLAEISGLIGRNSKPPADQTKPLASLSRDQLEAELAALERGEG